jgi:hypothetical protein
MQAKIHNVQITNNIKNRKKAEAGALLLCSSPHSYKPSFSLGTFCQSKSAQSSNHQVNLVHTPKIRTEVLITDLSADM